MLSLQDTQLMTEQQDFEVFVAIGAVGSHGDIKQQGKEVCEEKEDHGNR